MRVPDFRVPRANRTSPGWFLVSVIVHLFLVVVFFAAIVVVEQDDLPFVSYVQLADPAFVAPVAVELPWHELIRNTGNGPVASVPEPTATQFNPPPPTVLEPDEEAGIPTGEPDDNGDGEPIILGDSVGSIAPVVAGRGRGRLLGPSFANGILWVQPTHVVNDLGEALAALSDVGALNQIVAAQILAFLDSIPRDSFAVAGAPSWTTEIDGQTFGIDGKWVHLGPIKIPTALLAFLPIPQGNIEQARSYELLQRMRNEVLRQAATMQNRDEVNGYIQEMRERADRERDEVRRSQGRPEPVIPPRDTLVP